MLWSTGSCTDTDAADLLLIGKSPYLMRKLKIHSAITCPRKRKGAHSVDACRDYSVGSSPRLSRSQWSISSIGPSLSFSPVDLAASYFVRTFQPRPTHKVS